MEGQFADFKLGGGGGLEGLTGGFIFAGALQAGEFGEEVTFVGCGGGFGRIGDELERGVLMSGGEDEAPFYVEEDVDDGADEGGAGAGERAGVIVVGAFAFWSRLAGPRAEG